MEAVRQEVSGTGLEILDRRPAAGDPGVCVGTLVQADLERGVFVVYPGQPDDESLPARTAVAITPADAGRQVVLVFEDADPYRPIVLGLLQAQPVWANVQEEASGRFPAGARREIRLDGRSVRIEAERELVLQCGKSSITLHADGEIYVKGMKIVSRARGTHKIKGANVLIN